MSLSLRTRPRTRLLVVAVTIAAMVAASLALPTAEAAGPPYDGPITQATGPAFFGPAPNPIPYCENPTYFDPFPENVSPIGRIDVTGTENASVTTNGVTMNFELTAEGAPDTQYPGFFPQGGDGDAGDQPKGVEMAAGDAATISLSEPLFYTQWVFTDVDRDNEGFFVTPAWTSAPGQVAVFGGDPNFDFTGTSQTEAAFNDTDTVAQPSEALAGRVQVDLLGAATGISVVRDVGSGQSGFAIGGGCEPLGVAKELTSPPTWNGTSFDVTYTIRVRNNLPSAATISSDITAALAAAQSGTTTGAPVGIDLQQVTLEDLLADPAFSSIDVISNVNTSGNVATNPNYDGVGDIGLLAVGETIPPESEEEFVLTVQYTPDAAGPVGPSCVATYQLLNQAQVGGIADGVDVVDLSDNGADPDPGVNNGAGANDDPTPVNFDCPPVATPVLDIVKTVLPGPGATCPGFDAGVAGDGTPLSIDIGETVTYCISVSNPGTVDIDNVVISDPQAPASFDGTVGLLAAGAEATVAFDLVVDDTTPTRNVASATGDDPAGGQLPPVTDPALIDPNPLAVPSPAIALTKTVLPGADADCATAVEGVDEFVLGETGAPITWCFVATNTGDTSLTSVLFTDEPAGIVALDLLAGLDPAVLAPGESISLSEFGTIPATGLDNVASVVGTPSAPDGTPLPGQEPVNDENDASVNEAAIALSKTVAEGADADCATAVELVSVGVGTDVTYCFTVTNTGGVTLRVEQVDDDTLGVTVPIPAAQQDIAPGASVTVSYSTTATEDLVNTASVTGVPIDEVTGDPIPDTPPLEAEDPAEVETLEANLSIIKSNDPIDSSPIGREVPYSLEIANAGPDPAVNVVVVDTMPVGLTAATTPDDPDWACDVDGRVMTCAKATPLAAGDSVTLSYRVLVGEDAVVGSTLVNTAAVTSDTPDPDPTDNEDTEIIRVTPPPVAPTPPPDEPLDIVIITNPPPGPATPPNPVPAPPTPPAPPLAITGGPYSRWLILASAAMTSLGGVFYVGGRRRFDSDK